MIIGNTFKSAGEAPLNLFKFEIDFYIAFISIGFLLVVEYFEEYKGLYQNLKLQVPRPWKWAILTVLLFFVLVLGVWQGADFLYFQF